MRELIIALAALTLTSCRDSTAPASVGGTYVLRLVDGLTPPVVLYEDETETDEMVSGEVRLNDDMTFVDITAMRITVNGVEQIDQVEATGTYSVEGDVVTFTMSNGGRYQMVAAGDSLVQDWYGLELVYTR